MFRRLDNETERGELETMAQQWVIDARQQHDQMWAEWDKADDYFENDQVPTGFQESAKQALVDKQDPTTEQTRTKQYVVVNKVRETHEAILGDFIDAKKTITTRGRSPKDKKFGKVVKQYFEYMQDRVNLWDGVMVPTIDCSIRRGIHWIYLSYNPNRDLPLGKIEIEEVSCRDILLDKDARKTYYDDSNYRIWRQRFNVKKANKVYGKYLDTLVFNREFTPDNESDQPYHNAPVASHEQFCTIYRIQYFETETRYFRHNKESDRDEPIDEQTFEVLQKNQYMKDSVFQEDEDVYYEMLYNRGTGVFSNEEIEYGQYTLIPMMNIRSEGRLYPIGDTVYYSNLQDLFNVLVSVLLDNAKKGNMPWVGVDPESYADYPEQIDEAVKHPGEKVIPARSLSINFARSLNEGVIQLLQQTEKFIYDAQSKHAASRGELPTRQIAQKTFSAMISQDRVSHGRKDIMIRWTMTEVAKLVYKIVAKKFTEPHWVQITDQTGGENYIPINFTCTEQEYKGLIFKIMGLDPNDLPKDPQGQKAIADNIAKARKNFEDENEVRTESHMAYEVAAKQEGVAPRTIIDTDMPMVLEKAKMTMEDFQAIYQPTERPFKLYFINDMTQNPDIDIIYDVDFDSENEKQYRENRAFTLFKEHVITAERLLKDIEYPDASQAVKESDQANQLMSIGKAVANNPQIYQAVMAMLNKLNQPQPSQVAAGVGDGK